MSGLVMLAGGVTVGERYYGGERLSLEVSLVECNVANFEETGSALDYSALVHHRCHYLNIERRTHQATLAQ